jgi:hypothetical protein
MSVESYFGPGTTPERVAEAIDRAKSERNRNRPSVSTSQRERFFQRMAEERKRAEAS